MPANSWVNLVATASADNLKLFVNGTEVGQGTIAPGSRLANTSPLLIGSGARPDAPAEFFKGDLDDLRIYNRSLSDTEVGSLYALELSGVPEPEEYGLAAGVVALVFGVLRRRRC